MARHRSPHSRHSHRTSPSSPATRRAQEGTGSGWSGLFDSPARRGTAVVAVTGGVLSLIGAVPGPTQAVEAPAVLRAVDASPDVVAVSTAVLPVVPEPRTVDAAELVKAVQFAEQEVGRLAAEQAAAERAAAEQAAAERKAAEERAARTAPVRAGSGSTSCGLNTSGLGAVKAHVRAAASFLGCQFGKPQTLGVAGRGGPSDHPAGKALDFMVGRGTGDALAACALANKDALGITYVIWRQRINDGSGWEAMEDRGDPTANHMDHVHVSFGNGGGSAGSRGC